MYQFDPALSTTQLFQVGTNGIPSSGASGNNLNFAPRVGFAYRLTNKAVVHAGFGLYYAAPNVQNSSGMSMNAPALDYWAFNNSATFGASNSAITQTGGTTTLPFDYLANGFNHTREIQLAAKINF